MTMMSHVPLDCVMTTLHSGVASHPNLVLDNARIDTPKEKARKQALAKFLG